MLETRITHLSSIEIQVNKRRQILQMSQTDVRYPGLFEVKSTQRFALTNLLQSPIRDFGSPQVQPDQLIQFWKMNQSLIGQLGSRQMKSRFFFLGVRRHHSDASPESRQRLDRLLFCLLSIHNRTHQTHQQG